MKRVIDGKVYDTETAEEIHEWSNSYGKSDFKWCEESLYRTKKGAWFVVGEGGPMTRWRTQSGNAYTYGGGLEALTEAEAMEWMEQHDADADVIQQYFPKLVEEA